MLSVPFLTFSDMFTLFIIFVIFILCAYVALSRKYLYWQKRQIPHLPVSTLFGNFSEIILLKKNLGQVYDDIYNAFPHLPYVGVYKMTTPAILIRDPELIKEVLVKNFNSFYKNDIYLDKKNDYLLAKNPFFSTGSEWKNSRGQLLPTLTNNKMKSVFPLMEEVCQQLVKHLEDPSVGNGGVEIKSLCGQFTMNVVALSVLGLEANSFASSDTDYIKSAKQIFSPGIFMSIKFFILIIWPHLAKYLNIKIVPDTSAIYFKTIINETLEYREKNNIVRNDFLNSMQELQKKLGKNEFSNSDITGHCLSFFIDGFETTSVVLSFILYDLGTNIKCQEKLREEIENTLIKGDGKFTFELIQNMTYLNKFINESTRIHPANYFLAKSCTEACQFPPINNNAKELLVEPGTSIILPVYSLHCDPNYFPDPDKFDPERFSNENTIKECTFMPFGGGPRACIGQKFALAQIRSAVVYLVVNYEIRLHSKTKTPLQVDSMAFLLGVKGGIWLNFIKRKKDQ